MSGPEPTEPVRPVTRGDVAAIKRIADATGLFPSSMLDDMIAPYFVDRDSKHLWVAGGAESAGAAVGFAYCEPERMTVGTWNVLAIGVLPEHQGRGIGAAIMGYLEHVLRRRGQRILLVETSAMPEFQRTREFYGNLNYTAEARIRDYYDAGDDKIVFWKSLP